MRYFCVLKGEESLMKEETGMKKWILVLAVLLTVCGCSAKKSEDDGYSYGMKNSSDSIAYVDGSPEYYENNGAEVPRDPNQEKLVYTGNISLETKNYEDFTAEVFKIVSKYRGFKQAVSENVWNNRRHMSLTVRIPAEHFEEFLDDLRNTEGSLVSVSTYVDNITKQYYDNELQIQSLETQHERLLELLEKAANLSDVIQLEERLSDVEYRLNKLYSEKNTMDADVAFSTVEMTIDEVTAYTETTFLKRIKDAFGGSWRNFTDNLEDGVIWIIYALPALIIAGIAVFFLRKPAKKLWNRHFGRKMRQQPEEDNVNSHE